MKSLVIYDSNYGNTKLVAEEIAKNIGDGVKAISVKKIDKSDIKDLDLLIIGSPINGWRPTESIVAFLEDVVAMDLKNIKFTTFDTRVKLIIHGDAKDKIANSFKETGAKLIIEPMAFFVTGTEGPLFDNELVKAADWADKIKKLI
jgi:flavodoxin